MAPNAVRCTAMGKVDHKGLGLEKGGSTNCREAHHAAKPFAENARTELRASVGQEVAAHRPEIDHSPLVGETQSPVGDSPKASSGLSAHAARR